MYLNALPEVVKNAAAPLAQTDKIVMYGDGNSTKLVKDVMTSAGQVMDGVKESTGIDLQALLAGIVGGRTAAQNERETVEVYKSIHRKTPPNEYHSGEFAYYRGLITSWGGRCLRRCTDRLCKLLCRNCRRGRRAQS